MINLWWWCSYVVRCYFSKCRFANETTKRFRKIIKVGQYASGGLGNFLADLTLAIPTMTLGSMKLTKEAIEAGVGASGIAKSIGQDAFRNANVFGSSEFALTKLYGGSDEEAISNALGW